MAATSPLPSPFDAPDWTARFARRAGRGGDALTAILSLAATTDVITFSGGFPAPEVFPVETIRRLTETLLDEQPQIALQYSPTEGLPVARQTIRDMLLAGQGRVPDDVVITSGGIEALQLLARTFADAGDLVLVESPSYLGGIMAFRGFEADVHAVPMDRDGLRVDVLEDRLRGGLRPKLIYVIPDHQNPTGLSLTPERRERLVEVCRHYGVLIVEDVAYRDLGFDGTASRSLWSLGPDVVVQIGTFSKVFTPGVRLGWAVGPQPVLDAMVAAKQNSDQCAGAFGQMLMVRYLQDGHLDRNLVAARGLYSSRADAMLSALQEHMPHGVDWTRPRGGFFVWLTGPLGMDARQLTRKAGELGVAYVPGSPFFASDAQHNTLRLAFSRATESDIAEGVRRLASLFPTEGDR